MIDILILLLLNSFACIGFNIATEKGKILHWIEQISTTLPTFIINPLWACPYCMASLHSIYFIIPIHYYLGYSYWFTPIYILTLSGLNAITYNVTSYLRSINGEG